MNPREEFQKLSQKLSQEVPGFRWAYKDDPPQSMSWTHRWIHSLGRLFIPKYQTQFYHSIMACDLPSRSSKGLFFKKSRSWVGNVET